MKAVGFVLLLFVSASLNETLAADSTSNEQGTREQAEKLWELAIAAKGGRERLFAVRNMVIQKKAKYWFGFFQRAYQYDQSLYVFPDKMWSWEDARPSVFGLLIRMYDTKRDIAYHVSFDDDEPEELRRLQDSSLGAWSLKKAQLHYLLETAWVKPTPISVDKQIIGGNTVDVVQTLVDGERIGFALNRKTHLPRYILYYSKTEDRVYQTIPLSDYAPVNGVQVPLKYYGLKNNVLLNVDYDEEVFSRSPSVAAGPDAWKGN